MKIPINIASQPFRRDRAMVVASVAVSVALAGTLGLLITLALADRRQMADARAEVRHINQQIRGISQEQARLNAFLRQPENASAVENSVFINSLLLRKGISWNRIFTDLEKVVPWNVRVIQIRPSIDSHDRVTLDMLVASDKPGSFTEMLKTLGGSALFEHAWWSTVQYPTQAEPSYRLRVKVDYAQVL